MGRALYPYIFRLLYRTADVETAVEHILEVVGRTYDVSRVYIFENSPDDRACSNTFEWCGEGVPPQKSRLQNLPYWDDLPDYPAHFDENGVFCCPGHGGASPALVRISGWAGGGFPAAVRRAGRGPVQRLRWLRRMPGQPLLDPGANPFPHPGGQHSLHLPAQAPSGPTAGGAVRKRL